MKYRKHVVPQHTLDKQQARNLQLVCLELAEQYKYLDEELCTLHEQHRELHEQHRELYEQHRSLSARHKNSIQILSAFSKFLGVDRKQEQEKAYDSTSESGKDAIHPAVLQSERRKVAEKLRRKLPLGKKSREEVDGEAWAYGPRYPLPS